VNVELPPTPRHPPKPDRKRTRDQLDQPDLLRHPPRPGHPGHRLRRDERDFDLTARIQFVNEGHATGFDFSAYVLVSEDLLDLEEERQKVADEIAAVNNLLEAVEAFHGEFLTQASKALDRLAALQASAQK
jgi:hypothetical protein